MALNRRLCFTAQEPWMMMAYEMIFLIFSSFPGIFGAIFAADRCFVKSNHHLKLGDRIRRAFSTEHNRLSSFYPTAHDDFAPRRPGAFNEPGAGEHMHQQPP
jgi:hypothetical protein